MNFSAGFTILDTEKERRPILMYSCNQLLQALEAGQCDAPLAAVYTAGGLTRARA